MPSRDDDATGQCKPSEWRRRFNNSNRCMDTNTSDRQQVAKARTGIPGLDDITNGGLPAGRPTLISGGPGSGKTLLGVSFLVEGARRFGEPGVLVSFEENAADLALDVRSLGYDLDALCDEKKLLVKGNLRRSTMCHEFDKTGLTMVQT
jgi:KaiC/GvpD/RAD55 family RecA-like ATPase